MTPQLNSDELLLVPDPHEQFAQDLFLPLIKAVIAQIKLRENCDFNLFFEKTDQLVNSAIASIEKLKESEDPKMRREKSIGDISYDPQNFAFHSTQFVIKRNRNSRSRESSLNKSKSSFSVLSTIYKQRKRNLRLTENMSV